MQIAFTGKRVIFRGIGGAAPGGDVSICARDAATLEATRAETTKHRHPR